MHHNMDSKSFFHHRTDSEEHAWNYVLLFCLEKLRMIKLSKTELCLLKTPIIPLNKLPTLSGLWDIKGCGISWYYVLHVWEMKDIARSLQLSYCV